MPQLLIIVLLLLLFAGVAALGFDARQRRIDRHLATALPNSQSATTPSSIRRAPVESKWLHVYRLANYRPGSATLLRPELVLLAGALAAGALVYVNTLVGFSALTVSLAAATAAIGVVRRLRSQT